jgi:membrane protease YdiL (CAAX protease family)
MELVVTAVLMFFATTLIGGLALLAQWARKNRAAEISLIVVVLFFSVLVVGLGALTAVASFGGLLGGEAQNRTLTVASTVLIVLAGLVGIALCVPPLRRVTSRRGRRSAAEDPDAFETAPQEDAAVGGRWADPPVFYGLWLAVTIIAYNLVNLLFFPVLVESGAFGDAAVTPALVLISELPFVVVALCGVGFLVRRDFRETLVRLGYGPVSARQLALVPPFVAAAIGFALASDWIFVRLQPGLSEQVNEVSQGLFSTSGMSLFSAILFGLLIGIGAAAGEETLFRGAVQPTLGIALTSLLFASVHTQYGLSIILVHIFLLSVGLGLLRKYANTTLAFITHATYNFTLVLLSYFFGI